MNERIKELASQAYGLCKKINDEGQEVVLTDEWNQKFAELIVLECAAYLNGAAEVYDQKDQDTVDRAARHIKKYFGVE